MRLTSVHVNFWHSKKPQPQWMDKAVGYRLNMVPGIDDCVNAHAGLRITTGVSSATVLLSLLRTVRRIGGENLQQYLERLAINPGTVISPQRRAGYARKWSNLIKTRRKANVKAQNH